MARSAEAYARTNGRAAFADAAGATDPQAFVADPPPIAGDPTLKPWATRQFEALQRRTVALQGNDDALAAALVALEARLVALEDLVEADTWDR